MVEFAIEVKARKNSKWTAKLADSGALLLEAPYVGTGRFNWISFRLPGDRDSVQFLMDRASNTKHFFVRDFHFACSNQEPAKLPSVWIDGRVVA